MAWFDFTPHGIVEVGIGADIIGDVNGVEAVASARDPELYARQHYPADEAEAAVEQSDVTEADTEKALGAISIKLAS